jgi:hypothetical protein
MFERGPGRPLEVRTAPSNPLPLASHMLSFGDGDIRRRERLRLYADLLASTPLFLLSAGLEDPPGAIADTLEGALTRSRELAASAA